MNPYEPIDKTLRAAQPADEGAEYAQLSPDDAAMIAERVAHDVAWVKALNSPAERWEPLEGTHPLVYEGDMIDAYDDGTTLYILTADVETTITLPGILRLCRRVQP